MLPSRLFFDDSFFKGEETVKCDVFEKDGNVFVAMEAPGYTKEDISIMGIIRAMTIDFL